MWCQTLKISRITWVFICRAVWVEQVVPDQVCHLFCYLPSPTVYNPVEVDWQALVCTCSIWTSDWWQLFYCCTNPRAIVVRPLANLWMVAPSNWEKVSRRHASGGVIWAYGYLCGSPDFYLVLHAFNVQFHLVWLHIVWYLLFNHNTTTKPSSVAGHGGGRKLSCIDGINTTIYYRKSSHGD